MCGYIYIYGFNSREAVEQWRRCFDRPAMNQKRSLDATGTPPPLPPYTHTLPVDVVEEYLCGRNRVNHFNYDRVW